MELTTITIGTHSFVLRASADLDALRAELLRAVRDGGGIVEIPAAGSDRVSTFMSAGVPVLFEQRLMCNDGADAGWNDETPIPWWDEFNMDFV